MIEPVGKFITTYTSNDLVSHIHTEYATIDHTHSNYVTSSEVSTIVNSSIESGEITVSGSIIRKITRGTNSCSTSVSISCSITDTNKVIVILNCSSISSNLDSNRDYGGLYLKSISNDRVVVATDVNRGCTFSYQIIEFM